MFWKLKINVLSCSTSSGGKRPFHAIKKYMDGEKLITYVKIINKFFEKIFLNSKVNKNRPKLIII